ncbi:MAG: serine--tRNA ligase [Flavobacteriaceae bacterium]|nr:serine--tRNA ligase [Flavobacteriaceae bacterium]MDG1965794.1 serine--tRNA ligase [Flavobacteriaceae bacterium]
MLPLAQLREQPEKIKEGLTKRNFPQPALVDQLLETDRKRRTIQSQLDETLSKSNQLAKEIGALFKSGQIGEANELKTQTAALKTTAKELQEQLQNVETELLSIRTQIPNVPDESVPSGTSENDNEEVFSAGNIPDLGDQALPHWELATQYDLIDFDLGSKITGAGFPVYKGKGAKLQRALIQYFLDKNTTAGYTEFQVPYMVNEESGFGTGQLPDKEGQMYHIPEDGLYLIPTAEVPLTNLFRNQLLEVKDLPICLTGYTPCFRREAGSYGANVRGLNRLHQFDKVEIVRLEEPQNSRAALDGMVDHVKSILEELELPYRILKLCGGDLGFTAALTFDFEVYSTAQKRWLEISSVSTFNSFQSERLQLRYKDKNGKKQAVHTLNGSSLALPRVVAGLLENNQNPNGISIPKALIPYTGFDTIN